MTIITLSLKDYIYPFFFPTNLKPDFSLLLLFVTLGSWIGDLRGELDHPGCDMSELSSSKICFTPWILRQEMLFQHLKVLVCFLTRGCKAYHALSLSRHIPVVMGRIGKENKKKNKAVFGTPCVYPSVLLIVTQIRQLIFILWPKITAACYLNSKTDGNGLWICTTVQ